MSLKDELEFSEHDQQDETQEAYDEAKRGPVSGDLVFNTWTLRRHSVAMTLGCKVILAVGPAVKGLLDKGTYSNALRDVVIVLWLSSQDDDKVKLIDRSSDPLAYIDEAFEWAESVQLGYGTKLYMDGLKIIEAIVLKIFASMFTVDETDKKPSAQKKTVTAQRGKSKRRS